MSKFRETHKILQEIVSSPYKNWRLIHMADNRFSCGQSGNLSNRDIVCIETNRILDACRDRDCFEDVRVMLTDFGNDIIERTNNVRVKSACIAWTYINIDPVQFNRGFYTVTIKFYIRLVCEACIGGKAQEFDGIAVVEKKVILYGSESNVSVFRSVAGVDEFCSTPEPVCCTKNSPNAIVEVVDPIVLNTRVVDPSEEKKCYCCCCVADIPESVMYRMGGNLSDDDRPREKTLVVSLGIFSVIKLVRPAQYLVNATEFCVPDKECVASTDDNPCSLFKNMAFPVNEFCSTPINNANSNIEKRCGN